MTPDKALLQKFQRAEDTQAAIEQLQGEFEVELCARDYQLLEDYYPRIFAKVCELIAIGIEPANLEKWARRVVGSEPILVQRVVNAAKYEKGLQVGK